jgi:ABC-type multidrug transport system fused ATPase/permease subunit
VYAFSLRLLRPYWKWLIVVVVTMVAEIAMTLASPWPLKIVIDSVFATEPLPWLFAWLVGPQSDRLSLLNVAVAATVVIALLQASGAYLNAFYTVSIGQWIAHDLRQSVYAHLQRLSMSYYDRQQVGPLISTITDDIDAVQEFISTSLLDLVIDSLTIVGMLVVTFGYDHARPVLTDTSFGVEPGQLVGLAGPSGSGKSTLVSSCRASTTRSMARFSSTSTTCAT